MNQLTSPFKFLDSYNQKDKDIFFGREKETEALYNALSGVKHLLVYGPSGSGKTSLVECGLRNQFSDADWFALTIRRGSNIASSVFDEINKVLKIKMDLDPETHLPKNPKLDFGEALENLFTELYQPVYLLFDQFEELLISGTDNEKVDFFTRLNRLIRYKVPCRVMLIMREEFIGNLSEFEHLCPSIFQQRFRLEKMRKDSVREVIQKTLEASKYYNAFRVEQSEQLVSAILSKLPDNRQEIELAHVQVFLDELWKRADQNKSDNSLPVLQAGLIKSTDNLEGVLDSFLKNQVKELESNYGEKIPLEVLAAMVSEKKTKLQLTGSEIVNDLEKNDVKLIMPLYVLLKDLEKRRIIRTIKSNDQTQFEIAHDLLALVIGHNRTDEMKLREKASDIYELYEERKSRFSQEDLDYIRPYQKYKPYPSRLAERVKESEEYLHLQQEQEKQEKELQLTIAKEQAEKEKQLRLSAQKSERKSKVMTYLSLFISLITMVIAFVAIEQKMQISIISKDNENKRNQAIELLAQKDLIDINKLEVAGDFLVNGYPKIAAIKYDSAIKIIKASPAKELIQLKDKELGLMDKLKKLIK